MKGWLILMTWMRTWGRVGAASVAIIAIWLNPHAPTVVTKALETSSDGAVEITAPHRPVRSSVASVRAYVQTRASRHGWSWSQWRAVAALVTLENSDWRTDAKNRMGSSAYGLFQILKTPHDTPLHKQVDRFIKYIVERYNNDPRAALAHHREHGWY